MRYGQVVMGPAGSGKSTYCSNIVKHCVNMNRQVHVINLDPAAEEFHYPLTADIKDLVEIDDVIGIDSLRLGPNGGLIFCMEYLVKNFGWLEDQLDSREDEYFLFDCPGQIELYTHMTLMKQIVTQLKAWNFNICAVYLIECQFVTDVSKFCFGVLSSLSTMLMLEVPHVNVFTKIDLLDKSSKEDLHKYFDPDPTSLLSELSGTTNKKFYKLNEAICQVIDDFSLVKFLPLDMSDEDSLMSVLLFIDNAIQFGEDLDVKVPKLQDAEFEDMENI